MSLFANRKFLWLTLIIIAGIPRILGAFLLPNTFGDAYVYIRDIGNLSTKIAAGSFALTDLYGFWLPLYQFIAALFNVVAGNGFYSGKIVSAIFGVGVCLLVYSITARVVGNKIAPVLAFLLIALNPLHILNSTSALTDVPHGFFVLASVYFISKNRWTIAAIFAALAGFTRVESWMFLALLPFIQLLRERRASLAPIVILIIPPLFWFYISWKATGDWLACFKARQQYHDWLLIQNPALAQFSFAGVSRDAAMFVSGVDAAVLIAAVVAAWLVFKTLANRKDHDRAASDNSASAYAIMPLLIVFFAFLALLVLAYATHQQPIIFPRYGLILFSLGIPILVWTYFAVIRNHSGSRRRVLTVVIVLCALNWSAQFAGAIGELNRYSAQRGIADYLREHFDPNSGAKIFCDEDTVRVLSGIPSDRFLTSAEAQAKPDGFLDFLKNARVQYLVYAKRQGSMAVRALPDAESSEPSGYCVVMHSYADFLLTDIWIFRACGSR